MDVYAQDTLIFCCVIQYFYSCYFGLIKTLVPLQGFHRPEHSTSGGFLGHPPSTMPMFLKSKHSKGDGSIQLMKHFTIVEHSSSALLVTFVYICISYRISSLIIIHSYLVAVLAISPHSSQSPR